MMENESPLVYVLVMTINHDKKYYVTDLNGSLSRNPVDSMLFWDEITAEAYAGPIENLVEKKTETIATVSVRKIPLSGVIPLTVFESVSCP